MSAPSVSGLIAQGRETDEANAVQRVRKLKDPLQNLFQSFYEEFKEK